MPESKSLTPADILAGLRLLGIQPGFRLIAHSSLRSFGTVEGGALTVIQALMEAVTPQGTLLMVSFNHEAPFQDGPGYYHPLETPTIDGAIPDLFWRLPGVQRSLDPTHAFAAWGRDAVRYTAAHHRTLTMGPESPLGLLHADGGYGLLLGVGYEVNTFHHVVETCTEAPCLGKRSEAYPVILPDGRRVMGRTWGWRGAPCPINDESRYPAEMRRRGLEKVIHIGESRVTLFRLADCYEVIAGLLRTGIDGYPPCSGCSIRPRLVPQTVASDWDEADARPLPDSVAWTY